MDIGYRGDTSPRRGHDAPVADPVEAGPVTATTEAPGPEPALSASGRRLTGWQVLAAAAVVVGVAARFVAYSHLWLDETLSVNIARLPLGELLDALRHDGAPPLYYVLLHGWMDVFGTGTIAVRALSGVFAVAALPLIWLAGSRLGGRRVAAASLILLATSPFAIRYATEARMYSLVTALALVGWLALGDLLERFSWPRAVLVSVTTALLMLTHYWSFYLLVVAAAAVAWRAWRGPRRAEALRAGMAMAVGSLAFLPWLPTFLFQLRHTGTPWAGAPDIKVLFDTVFQFTGGFWAPGFFLGLLVWFLILLALLGRAVDGRRIELDLRTRAEAHPVVVVGFGSLTLAVVVGMATGSGFAVRYASALFPFFVLLVALGTTRLVDQRVFRAVVGAAAVLGLIAAIPGVVGERTSAPKVARVLRAQARPGDVVAYCPDQVAPSVNRLLGEHEFIEVPFPDGGSPELVDWVDYAERNRAATTAEFSQLLLDRAGPDNDIWLVWAPGYQTFGPKCTVLQDRLEAARPDMTRIMRISSATFEQPGLVRYRPS